MPQHLPDELPTPAGVNDRGYGGVPAEPSGALAGVRVLDLGSLPAQYGTKLLADLGADVLLVEPPGGTPARRLPPFFHDRPGPATSLSFWFANTSKRSLTCNLQTADGRALFARLLATAQVVVADGPPERVIPGGADYATVQAGQPGLVWASVSGFGTWGPHADWAGADLVGVAMSGILTLAGYPDRAPVQPPGQQGWVSAGVQAAQGILLALRVAARCGRGQQVEVSVQEALSLAQETAMQFWDFRKTNRGRRGDERIIPGVGTYECADGHVAAMVAGRAGAPFSVLVSWMAELGEAGDLRDEPYASLMATASTGALRLAVAASTASRDDLNRLKHVDGVVKAFFMRHSKQELYEEGQRRRLLIAPVSTAADLVENPQLQARHWYQDVEHPELNATISYPGPPFRLSASPWRIAARAPLLGEHNAEIWGDVLGLNARELAALAAADAI